jgi:hypothetical protein
MSFETNGVDSAYFISSSASAWKSMLKMTGARLELLQTSDQYEFFEGGLRGGLAMTCNRYFKCNRPDLPQYDETHPTKTALDLDANALYGSAMESTLPDGGLVDVEPQSFNVHNPKYGGLPQYPGQACEEWQTHTGAFVECDIEYPAELHDLHSDYPLLPESMIVEDHMIAPIRITCT